MSDSEVYCKCDVYYTIAGPGVDQYPMELFKMDRETGMLTVYRSVDREEFPKFTVSMKKGAMANSDLQFSFKFIV